MADSDRRLARNDTIRTFLTPLAIFASALTVFAGFRHDDAVQRKAARETFQLEAAKLVMAQPSCVEARQKAVTLVKLFPGRLPRDFVNRSSTRWKRETTTANGTTRFTTYVQGPCGRRKVSEAMTGPALVQGLDDK